MSTAAGAPEQGDSAPSLSTTTTTASQQPKRPKSPPLAFEPTPNDALVAFPPQNQQDGSSSPQGSAMGRLSRRSSVEALQMIVDQQADALQLLHEGFAAERRTWAYEKERFLHRIASLEKLLKTGNSYSPAKSPVTSPTMETAESYRSPSLRGDARNNRLPSIAEDDSTLSLAERRGVAPATLDLPDVQTPETIRRQSGRQGSVSFGEPTPEAPIKVEEIPISFDLASGPLSPLPLEYRVNAGHTPLGGPPRPPTPPPKFIEKMDGIDDTPTRRNTAINGFLTKATDEDEDPELKGPLNMPELPHMPDASNFTMEMLSKKLAQIEAHPERNKPGVFAAPSPGLASAEDDLPSLDSHLSPLRSESITSGAIAPVSTQQHQPASNLSSQARSPNSGNPMSPEMAALSQSESKESKIEEEFAQGGIKLKKKASTNFGAPFGQLGFSGTRRTSELDALNG